MKWLINFFGRLRTRLISIAVFGLLILSFTFYFYSIKTQRSLFRQSFDKSTNGLMEAVKLGIEVGLSEENYATIQMVFNWAKSDKDVEFIAMTDESGAIFASFPEEFNFTKDELTLKTQNNTLEDSLIVKSLNWSAKLGHGKIFIGFSTKTLIEYESKTIYDIGGINIIFIAAALLAIILFTAGITKPLEKLRKVSDEIRTGNLEARMDETRGGTELTSVAVAFNQMVKKLVRTQQTLQSDINEAIVYINSLLPEPIENPVKIDWFFKPSERLGGDSFGYHFVGENKLAVYLIDVSGHGVGAALYSVSVFNIIREQSLIDTNFQNPAELLSSLNKIFQLDKYGDKYFTIWYGVLDVESGELVYSAAGHPPALIYSSGELTELDGGNIFIGAFNETEYANNKIQLNKNSLLYVFSDGLIELKNKEGKLMGMTEFKNILNNFSRESKELNMLAGQVLNESLQKVFEDDVSIIRLKF